MESNIGRLLENYTENELVDILRSGREFSKLMSYYKCAMMEVETKFKVLNENMSLEYDRNPIESIKTRIKTPESILEKMVRRDIPFNPQDLEEQLFDIAGVRVICSFPKDVYLLEEYLLRQDDLVLIQRKDYIANPKPNGYRSLHLIVAVPIFLAGETKMMNVEIQFRTIAMDFWASIEHKVKYKKNIDHESEVVEELRKCAEVSADLDLRMQTLHDQIAELE